MISMRLNYLVMGGDNGRLGCSIQLRDIKGKHCAPFGKTIMQDATEGTLKVTTD